MHIIQIDCKLSVGLFIGILLLSRVIIQIMVYWLIMQSHDEVANKPSENYKSKDVSTVIMIKSFSLKLNNMFFIVLIKSNNS